MSGRLKASKIAIPPPSPPQVSSRIVHGPRAVAAPHGRYRDRHAHETGRESDSHEGERCEQLGHGRFREPYIDPDEGEEHSKGHADRRRNLDEALVQPRQHCAEAQEDDESVEHDASLGGPRQDGRVLRTGSPT